MSRDSPLCIGALQGIFTAQKVVDAQGAYVTPGGVDTHVHLDQHIGGELGDNFEVLNAEYVTEYA